MSEPRLGLGTSDDGKFFKRLFDAGPIKALMYDAKAASAYVADSVVVQTERRFA